ncbi:hypothetical protein A3C09_03620 [Candidatus Uhrbacteria bacterium RIFCSPHIGHO2_02_FULL_47_44]|uniref:Uncharacterized protein n=1 Tax=Candidatus Uhrbacteria bacterium RIFCSPLOWO2_02_FULL_48_18 TaxID=1802408 RepID=A0A1F7V861_9BACT|nr:MAG: hypothetical protein A2839_04775 [Candidatus Uhrbacteria bacterium RIFCSPHIGHO2_01_FULL_47_10]OGL71295.1 MAG: hypothetical protein A3C09_03620 [Candidatus Uhrbacteria bacterium RIFCSPHIGHO2_02_FULL_47_44]OGL76107.1 MAG: hypothetical protein A3E97_02455 [Candidatus Uhrbacteria bacterium RIFCSPHIGHO2_12_FULL_47_12]OGL80389.1 MAG: hypothetical protein A3B20_03160 [Candidatus Uhrbacteria bacterium RIFCSPLOWO2_01_FULL_47_17]OGL86248.1 MAG: hypothetical protein A3I41_01650 [Candidatus Uhrbact
MPKNPYRDRFSKPFPWTAAFVVEHAQWRAKRGKSPSLSYKGERNPRKALELAKMDDALQNIDHRLGGPNW